MKLPVVTGLVVSAVLGSAAIAEDAKLAPQLVGMWKLVSMEESTDGRQWVRLSLPAEMTRTFAAGGQVAWSIRLPDSKDAKAKPAAPAETIKGTYTVNESERTLSYGGEAAAMLSGLARRQALAAASASPPAASSPASGAAANSGAAPSPSLAAAGDTAGKPTAEQVAEMRSKFAALPPPPEPVITISIRKGTLEQRSTLATEPKRIVRTQWKRLGN